MMNNIASMNSSQFDIASSQFHTILVLF